MDKSITKIKVRGYHLDVYQHVNNARYLELLEEARWSHYEEYPPSYFAERGWGFIIVNINIDYKHPAVLGDVLEIHTTLAKVGNTSLTFEQEAVISGTDKVAVKAQVTFVMMNLKTLKVMPVEGELKDLLLRKKPA